MYIYTIELRPGIPLSKPMMKAPPAFGWLLLGLVCSTVRTVSAGVTNSVELGSPRAY